MGRNDLQLLDRLIGEVSRGERDLSSIRDARLREAVRLALRLHDDGSKTPDAYTRARMRARILAGLRPQHPTLLDNAWALLELIARPAPYIVRGIALASVLVCLGMGAIVASADTLPDDLLYPIKIASEQVRLALADAPGDRAAVELSIAEHRLSEAEKLASSGRTSDALVASAMFTQHIASAAAELAPQPETDLSAQLESAFNAQRERAQTLGVTLSFDVKSARGAQILAMIALPTMAPGSTRLEQVAETAATVAVGLADAAELAASESASIPTAPPSGTATRSEKPHAVFAQRTEAARATEAQRATDTPRAAETARVAETQQRTDTPRGTEQPRVAETGRAATATQAQSAAQPNATEPAHATTRPSSAPRATIDPAQTYDPRAADAAKMTRKAADDARAAADKLKQSLNKNKRD